MAMGMPDPADGMPAIPAVGIANEPAAVLGPTIIIGLPPPESPQAAARPAQSASARRSKGLIVLDELVSCMTSTTPVG